MTDAPRDQNYVPVLMGVSSSDGVTPLPVQINPATRRIVVDMTGSGTGDVSGPASAVSGNFASFADTTGKKLEDSGASAADFASSASFIAGAGALTGPAAPLTIGTAAASAVGDFATAAQGALADTALQDASAFATAAQGAAVAGKKPYHGVVARPVGASNPLPTHVTTTTFTLGATANPLSYYFQGTLVNVTSDKTTTLSGAAGLYFIYFDAATGNLLNSTTFPGVDLTSNVFLATVFWNGTDYGLVNDERHGYTRDTAWHKWAHTTVGARYVSGLTLTHNGGTGAAATFATTAGEIADEDIQFVVNASSDFPTANAGRLLYQTGASSYAFVNAPATTPGYLGINNRPNVVSSTGYGLTQLSSAINRYINVFVYATTDLHTPVYFFTETASAATVAANGYTSLANARAAKFPNLSGFGLSAELKPIYRLIWRADGVLKAIDVNQDDYRTVSSLPQSAGTISTTAGAVSYIPTSPLTATNVQVALDEVAAALASPSGGSAFEVTAQSYEGPAIVGILGKFDATTAKTLAEVTVISDTLPVGSNLICELRKNSTSSGNILSSTLQVTTTESATNGRYVGTPVTSFSSASIADGDVLYAVLTGVGSTTPASNVRVILRFSA